jgi:hypothetical protein
MPTPTAVYTESHDWRMVRSSNSTDTSFTGRVITTTSPLTSTAGVLSTQIPGGGPRHTANSIILLPFGTDADDETFSVQLLGWRPLTSSGTAQVWVPSLLCQFAVTLSALTGVNSSDLENEEFIADTIDTVVGTSAVETISPATDGVANKIATIEIAVQGYPQVEVLFDLTGAASANALYTLV